MDSDLQRHHHFQHNNHHNMINNIHNSHHQQQQQQQPQQATNTGLTRYRSAPSSYFSDLINNGLFGDDDNDLFINSKVSNAETEKSLMKFMSSFAAAAGSVQDSGAGSTGQQVMNQGFEPEFMDSVKQEPMVYNSNSNGSSTVNESMDLSTNLVRQNSSPAGFVGHLDMGHGYPMMRSMDDFRASRGNVPSSMMTSAKRMKNEMGFASGSQLSNLSSGMLPRIPENESKVMEVKSVRNVGTFGSNSWDDSDILSDSFLKEFGESDQNKLSSLNSSDNQRNDVGRIRAPTTLVHHLSLPASSAELDKLMQHQDYVPLRSRAKRGCATHPRSIAERVRRTRISERMRKLQDLVPNMDKQTNTADMLDLAVDYIKELQKEAEALSDHHAKCTCPHKPKLVTQV